MKSPAAIWNLLETIPDPEIPVLSIVDLGIIRGVEIQEETVIITLTPTYTGCPAMDLIALQIRVALQEAGFSSVQVKETLSPAWTTDMISSKGKIALEKYGIAPPDRRFSIPEDGIRCAHCQSENTRVISEFGSTPCKALYQCKDCLEPFDYFKCH